MKMIPLAFALSALLGCAVLAEPSSPAKPSKPAAQQAEPLKAKFQAYDGDPANPKSMTFQINVIGLRQPTEFLPIGAQISNTPYIISSFTEKMRKHPKTGEEQNVSELKLVHTGTKDIVVLPLTVPTAIKRE